MNKLEFLKKADSYINGSKSDATFKLKDILGDNCPAYPGTWLYESVDSGFFNTPTYRIEFVERDNSDTYIKRDISKH